MRLVERLALNKTTFSCDVHRQVSKSPTSSSPSHCVPTSYLLIPPIPSRGAAGIKGKRKKAHDISSRLILGVGSGGYSVGGRLVMVFQPSKEFERPFIYPSRKVGVVDHSLVPEPKSVVTPHTLSDVGTT